MRTRWPAAVVLLLAACSGQPSKEAQLNAAANELTPEAASVLEGAAANGMNQEAALNEAAQAQASNGSTTAPPRNEARPNSAQIRNPPKAGEPVQEVPVNSE